MKRDSQHREGDPMCLCPKCAPQYWYFDDLNLPPNRAAGFDPWGFFLIPAFLVLVIVVAVVVFVVANMGSQ